MIETVTLGLGIKQIGIYLVTIIITEAVCLYLYKNRNIAGAKELLACQITRMFWIFGHFFVKLSTTLESALFWGAISNMASLLLPYFWSRFAIKISEKELKIPHLLKYIINLAAVSGCGIILSNFIHRKFIIKATVFENTLMINLGFLYPIMAYLAYFMLTVGTLVLLTWAFKSKGWRRKMGLMLSVSPLFTLSGHFLYFIPAIHQFSPLVIASLFTEIYSVWVFYRWRLFSIRPFAQAAVVKNIIDALITIDEQGYIVDVNKVATVMFPNANIFIGAKLVEADFIDEKINKIITDKNYNNEDIQIEHQFNNSHYKIIIIPLKNTKIVVGKTIIIKDITKEKEFNNIIVAQEKALAILQERNRIGREIHDGESQVWALLKIEIVSLEKILKNNYNDIIQRQIHKIKSIVDDMIYDTRESIITLKNDNNSFFLTLQNYLLWYEESYGIKVKIDISKDIFSRNLDNLMEVHLLRILKESLTNIRKHSGATMVEISAKNEINKIAIKIIDNGVGFELEKVEKDKYGISIMRERAKEIGFSFIINSKFGKGTTIELCSEEC